MKALLRIGTTSALALGMALAAPAAAQDQQTSETTTTSTDPVTDTKSTTKTRTTTEPATDATGAPATRTRSRTQTKTTTDASTAPHTTSSTTSSDTTAPAAPAAAAPAPAAPATAAPATAAPAAAATAAPAAATPNPAVGGAPMDAAKTVVDNASAAPNLSTLVGLVKAADLVPTLSAAGPYTVFAPTNDAFGRVAQVTRDALAKPEAKPTLARVLKYHVVPGTLTLADLKAKAATGGTLTTAEGQNLTVKVNTTAGGEAVELTDAMGNKSYIETPDVRQSNGIVHVVNGVLFPKLQ